MKKEINVSYDLENATLLGLKPGKMVKIITIKKNSELVKSIEEININSYINI